MSDTQTDCHVLREVSSRALQLGADSGRLPLFSKCRNEMLRLPAFLRYYRKLGVDRFFIVDNGSTDGTTEYLAAQPDVSVFRTEASFREARGGTTWLNSLLAQFGPGRWCITVDVDELLVYPGVENTSLRQFVDYLDCTDSQAFACLLLDMYPGGPLGECRYQAETDLTDAAPFFDPEPYRSVPVEKCPGFLLRGGVRERVFYPEIRYRHFATRLKAALYNRIGVHIPLLSTSRWLYLRRPRMSPCLTKVPLVRWDAGSQYLDVNHFVSPKRVSSLRGAVLHFKFLNDFHERAIREAARGEYADGASEYQRYAAQLAADPSMTLAYEGSARYTGSEQLTQLGLMRDSADWAALRAGWTVPAAMEV